MENKYLKSVLRLIVLILVLHGMYFLFVAPIGRSVNFGGKIDSVRLDDKNGSVYVTATQELTDFTCEIEIKKNTRCKDANKTKIDPAELKKGDYISVNFYRRPKFEDGVNKAVAKSPVTIYVHNNEVTP